MRERAVYLRVAITIVLCSALRLVAAESTPLVREAEEPAWLRNYYPYEQRIAGWVDNTARSIDNFFGTDEAWRTDNKSWLRVTEDLRWDQTDHLGNNLRMRMKLDVPTASEKLRFLVENGAPEQHGATQDAVPGLRAATNTETGTLFGLGTNLDSWAPEWQKKLQGGVRVRLPPDLYTRFIATRKWALGGARALNSYNRLAWFAHDGYSVNSQIDIGESLTPRWRLRYTTDLTWRENRDYLEFAESVNFAQILDARTAINYSVGFAGTGFEGPQITSYFLVTDYRRNIFRRIVFFDAVPEITFPRDEGFNPHWAITFRLELYFQKEVEE
jgi:hypothetical protein